MSYSICRIAKVKAGGVTGIQIHDRREKDNVSHTNEDIDWSKSKENVDLLNQQEKFRTVVSDRIADLNLPKALRKDATVMCQCLVTSDSAFFDKMTKQEQVEFFKKSLDFIENRYGKENMVSATVHFDEKTPHMHVNFVPVTQDGRLSARDLFSPPQLRKLQDDFNKTCRESGYDLERGELHSKKAHLSVEEYKVETKYEELKEKKAEIEKLEKVDKAVNLQAEKGKLTYSSKEVEAIKEQNKALRVELYDTKAQVKALENKAEGLQNRLLKAEKDLEGIKPHVERLKDLESENKELQGYFERKPDLKKAMTPFERQKNNAYEYGRIMVEHKNMYMTANEERRKSIDETNAIEKDIKKCNSYVDDLRHRQEQINGSMGRINALQEQLEQTTGLFKGKDRKALQEKIDGERKSLQELTGKLKSDFSIEPANIEQKIESIEEIRNKTVQRKHEQMDYTKEQEALMDKAVKGYKYYSSMSATQKPGFKEISSRHDARIELPDYNAKTKFLVSKGDWNEILERMETDHPTIAPKCKEMFEEMDRQASAMKTLSKATEWTMER